MIAFVRASRLHETSLSAIVGTLIKVNPAKAGDTKLPV
jgi:hypothetical protein